MLPLTHMVDDLRKQFEGLWQRKHTQTERDYSPPEVSVAPLMKLSTIYLSLSLVPPSLSVVTYSTVFCMYDHLVWVPDLGESSGIHLSYFPLPVQHVCVSAVIAFDRT